MKITFDPQKHFTKISQQKLAECCGLLLPWAISAIYTGKSMKASVEENYPFGDFNENLGMEKYIQPDGIFAYPDDPPLSPLVEITYQGETCYIYPHAWICIKNDTGTFLSRMD